MPNLTKKIQNTIFQHNLIQKNNKIVLAISGGPDSVCLFHIFLALQKKYALKLIIAHINYGLRGKDSQKDEDFVRRLAEKAGIELFVLKPVIKAASNLENTLREIRYTFFEKIRKENNFDLIATGHNADDQVETFFLHLLRGAGMTGLSAMRHKNKKIIRPLLGTWRKEIQEYLGKNDFSYKTDKTNFESIFTRNKIRNKLIPLIEKEINPNIKKTISEAIQSISDDYSFLDQFSKEAYQRNSHLSVKKILENHPAIQKRILLEAMREKTTTTDNVTSAILREITKILVSTKNKRQVVIFKGLKVERKGDRITIEKDKK